MIKGTNDSPSGLSKEEYDGFAVGLIGADNVNAVINNLEERRQNVLHGGVNCIPLPFTRFRNEVPGIEQGQYVVVSANQKVGKCFGKGTRVRMADNTIKNIEDLKVGDMVMSPNDEKPKMVEGLGRGREQMYRIHSEMHDDLIVNENHVMYLYKCAGPRRKARYFTLTVKELLELQKNVKFFRKYYQMVASDECVFEMRPQLPIEPYYYGLWLGDGDRATSYITTIDKEISDYLSEYAKRLGMKLSVSKDTRTKTGVCKYNIARKTNKEIGFKNMLGPVCGWQKEHINRDYLNASVEERYELLAGLIDTDGYLNKHKTGYQITLKSESLIKDIQELVRSLGLATTMKKKYNKVYNTNYYILRINGRNCVKIPVKIERKKCALSKKNPRHFSFSIEPIGEGDYYGIVLGGNHLFLLEDYTIVHNTNLANFVYVFHALDYAFEHKDQCSVHIIYFALEEAIQKIIERYMSYLLFKIDGYRLAPTDLRSTSVGFPVPEEVLNLLKSDKYQERLRFFEECVQFETENTNPTGILRVCEEYAKSVGDYQSEKIKSKGIFEKNVEVFKSYKQYDPNHYKICIIDHIGLVDKEQGFKGTKEAVDKTSEYFVKYLRNRYNFTCVAIQQQASDSEGLEAIKAKRMVPSAAGLGDSKYTARDADLVLGLFDPSKFGLPAWLGYSIQQADGTGLQNYGRFLYVLANRNGEMGGVCPLFFDGAVCSFSELPRPDDQLNMRYWYDKAKELKLNKNKNHISKSVLLSFFNNLKINEG